ncbi:D-tagaturonate epimerase UxaE [Bacillota bacterium]
MESTEKNALCHILKIGEEEVSSYPSSLTPISGGTLQMVSIRGEKQLLFKGGADAESGFHGRVLDGLGLLCPADHENRLVLNRILPFTKPVAFGRDIPTFGTGDRLGLASPGHILAFTGCRARPVLAQQSKRELTLTGRNFRQVLDDVCFSVFREGYRRGFGADGDHLKTKEDIREALDEGYTMITLDCSEQMGSGMSGIVNYAEDVYYELILAQGRPIDFELSIDETGTVTTAADHLYVASELLKRKVHITSLAPRFVGEFQKGIDYIGDISEFHEHVKLHAEIAKSFGYKLSIHSGSDKFSVFPLIGRTTGGMLHVKTSGTNWLEAVRIIALMNPGLYRRMHNKALECFNDARKHYLVSAELKDVIPIDRLSDSELPVLLEEDATRQLMHITYGHILGDKNLKTEIFNCLELNERAYKEGLAEHIGNHLRSLGLKEGANG